MIIFGELLHPKSKIHAYEEVCEMGGNGTVLTPLALILLLSILLYLPPVQNWAVKQVAAYASESTGMDISVKQVQPRLPSETRSGRRKGTSANRLTQEFPKLGFKK